MKLFISISLLFGGIYLYFYFNPSYKLSTEAKIYYSMGEYQIAFDLSQEALKLREYNTMAFHIKTRSELTLQMVKFIQEADEFQNKIIEIFKKGYPSKENLARIKMMTEIIISKYNNLTIKLIEDEELKHQALTRLKRFKKLNKEITEKQPKPLAD